jgi:hypothetical protein
MALLFDRMWFPVVSSGRALVVRRYRDQETPQGASVCALLRGNGIIFGITQSFSEIKW